MTLRIVKMSAGPVLVDDDPAQASRAPTELELLAGEIGVEPDMFRDRLRDEVQRRRREIGHAWKQLDETLEKRANGGR